MSTDLQSNETQTQQKKRSSTALLVLLIVFVILFLLTTAILGARLYEMATRDQYTVDMELGEADGSIELFRIEYANELGEITVRGVNADSVVAPGTTVNYDIRLRNNDDVIIDFLMTPSVEFLTDDSIPIRFKIVDNYGNYILGDDSTWVEPDAMNNLAHKGSIHPGEVFTYHVSWQWVFEVSQEQDDYDTFLGDQEGVTVPGVRVGIQTQSGANPQVTTKDITHLTHLRGQSFGCCWCCYLVWLLVLCCMVLVICIWKMRKKMTKLEEALEKFEATMKLSGDIVNQ